MPNEAAESWEYSDTAAGDLDEEDDEAVLSARMPSLAEMTSLLPELGGTFLRRALCSLQQLFAPLAALKLKKMACTARTRQRTPGAVRLTVEMLRTFEVFSEWPQHLLIAVVNAARYRALERGDVIVYKGEPSTSLSFVTAGSFGTVAPASLAAAGGGGAALARKSSDLVRVASLAQLRRFPHGAHSATPACFSPHVTVTCEPHAETVRASGLCDVFVVERATFAAALVQLSPSVRNRVVNTCFRGRVERLRLKSVLTPTVLRSLRLFQACPHNVLQEIANHCVPTCALPGVVLFHEGAPMDRVIFLVCGRVTAQKSSTSKHSNSPVSALSSPACGGGARGLAAVASNTGGAARIQVQDPASVHVVEAHMAWDHHHRTPVAQKQGGGGAGAGALRPLPPTVAVIGEENVLYKRPATSTFVTVTQCDYFELTEQLFDITVTMIPEVSARVMESMRATRCAEISTQLPSYGALLSAFPLLAEVVPFPQLVSLISHFQPNVHRARSVVLSKSEYVSSVVVLLRGHARTEDLGRWHNGDFAGFTGIVQHRWACSVIAQTDVEVLELPLPMFITFLRRHGLYERMRQFALHLMFPKAHTPEEALEAAQRLSSQRSPPLHPVSRSRTVPGLTKPPPHGGNTTSTSETTYGTSNSNDSSAATHSGRPPSRQVASQRAATPAATTRGGSSKMSASVDGAVSVGSLLSPLVNSVDATVRPATPTIGSVLVAASPPFHGMGRISSTTWVRRL